MFEAIRSNPRAVVTAMREIVSAERAMVDDLVHLTKDVAPEHRGYEGATFKAALGIIRDMRQVEEGGVWELVDSLRGFHPRAAERFAFGDLSFRLNTEYDRASWGEALVKAQAQLDYTGRLLGDGSTVESLISTAATVEDARTAARQAIAASQPVRAIGDLVDAAQSQLELARRAAHDTLAAAFPIDPRTGRVTAMTGLPVESAIAKRTAHLHHAATLVDDIRAATSAGGVPPRIASMIDRLPASSQLDELAFAPHIPSPEGTKIDGMSLSAQNVARNLAMREADLPGALPTYAGGIRARTIARKLQPVHDAYVDQAMKPVTELQDKLSAVSAEARAAMEEAGTALPANTAQSALDRAKAAAQRVVAREARIVNLEV